MTETDNPPPHTNGIPDDGLDDEDRTKIRPADIDADVREMERRKRVEMIMNSRLFREELERIIEIQMKDGSGGQTLLQSISDMMGLQGQRLQSAHLFRSSNCVAPINDIRGVESMGYAKGEKILRCKVAAVYRLMDLYGWTQNIQNHITARLNVDEEIFLVNPHGLLYNEITASSLVKVDMRGDIIESGTTNFGVNTATFSMHAAIHASRPDLKAIVHVHTPAVVAVSSLRAGLLPLSREAVVLGEISSHPFTGYSRGDEEKEKIVRNLGPNNKVLFLSNNGAVCCGETVEEAFYNVYNLVAACEAQLKLMPAGLDNLVLIPEDVRKEIYESSRQCPEGALPPSSNGPSPAVLEKKEKRWRIGGMEFEALMRMLDNAGFRTGYIYRTPLIKGDPPRPRNDVEVPPAVSSLGYLLEEEEMYRNGWKGRKSNDRTRWLNSPNVYQKVEILETGTTDPKKITKWVEAGSDAEWVAEGSPTHSSTPVKIESALQFVPKNTNPKEFKKLQQQIKENRRADKITSGPQSQLLEGVTWEEAKKLQDANISATGDQVILVGAASKGIIQRGFQHNATVYKTPYAKNPFDQMTDQEIEEYKSSVQRKQRGDTSYEDSESEALSSSAAGLPPRGKLPVSETADESRDEPRVLRINNKQVPKASQPEVVLSDDHGPGPRDLRRSVPRANSLCYNSSPSLYNSSCSISYNSTPSLYYNSTPTTLSYHSPPVEQAQLVKVKYSVLPERKKVTLVSIGNDDLQRTGAQVKQSNQTIRRRYSEIIRKKHHFMSAKPIPIISKRKSDQSIKSIISNLLHIFQDLKYSQSLRFPRPPELYPVCQLPCKFVSPPTQCLYHQSSELDYFEHQALSATRSGPKLTEARNSPDSKPFEPPRTHQSTSATQTYEQPFAKSTINSRHLMNLESPFKRMYENVLSEIKDKSVRNVLPEVNSSSSKHVGGDGQSSNNVPAIPETQTMSIMNLNSESKDLLMKSNRKLIFDCSPIDESSSVSSAIYSGTQKLPDCTKGKKTFLDELKSKLLSPNKGLNKSAESSKKYDFSPEIKQYMFSKHIVINNAICDDEISTCFNSPILDEAASSDTYSVPLSVYIPSEVDNQSISKGIHYALPLNYLSPIYEVSAEDTYVSEKFIRKIDKFTYNHVHSSGSIDEISSSVESSNQHTDPDHSVVLSERGHSLVTDEQVICEDIDTEAFEDDEQVIPKDFETEVFKNDEHVIPKDIETEAFENDEHVISKDIDTETNENTEHFIPKDIETEAFENDEHVISKDIDTETNENTEHFIPKDIETEANKNTEQVISKDIDTETNKNTEHVISKDIETETNEKTEHFISKDIDTGANKNTEQVISKDIETEENKNTEHVILNDIESGFIENDEHVIPKDIETEENKNTEHVIPIDIAIQVIENYEHVIPKDIATEVIESYELVIPNNIETEAFENYEHVISKDIDTEANKNTEQVISKDIDTETNENTEHFISKDIETEENKNTEHVISKDIETEENKNTEHVILNDIETEVIENDEHVIPKDIETEVIENYEHVIPKDIDTQAFENDEHVIPIDIAIQVIENYEHVIPKDIATEVIESYELVIPNDIETEAFENDERVIFENIEIDKNDISPQEIVIDNIPQKPEDNIASLNSAPKDIVKENVVPCYYQIVDIVPQESVFEHGHKGFETESQDNETGVERHGTNDVFSYKKIESISPQSFKTELNIQPQRVGDENENIFGVKVELKSINMTQSTPDTIVSVQTEHNPQDRSCQLIGHETNLKEIISEVYDIDYNTAHSSFDLENTTFKDISSSRASRKWEVETDNYVEHETVDKHTNTYDTSEERKMCSGAKRTLKEDPTSIPVKRKFQNASLDTSPSTPYVKEARDDKCPSFISIGPLQSSKTIAKKIKSSQKASITDAARESKTCERSKTKREFNRSLDSLHRDSRKSLSHPSPKTTRTVEFRRQMCLKENSNDFKLRSNSSSPRNVKSTCSKRNLFDCKDKKPLKKFERQCCKKNGSELKTQTVSSSRRKNRLEVLNEVTHFDPQKNIDMIELQSRKIICEPQKEEKENELNLSNQNDNSSNLGTLFFSNFAQILEVPVTHCESKQVTHPCVESSSSLTDSLEEPFKRSSNIVIDAICQSDLNKIQIIADIQEPSHAPEPKEDHDNAIMESNNKDGSLDLLEIKQKSEISDKSEVMVSKGDKVSENGAIALKDDKCEDVKRNFKEIKIDYSLDNNLQAQNSEMLTPMHQTKLSSKTNVSSRENSADFDTKSSCLYYTCQDDSFDEVISRSPYQLCFLNKKDEESIHTQGEMGPQAIHSTQLDKSFVSTSDIKFSFDNLSSIYGDYQSVSSSAVREFKDHFGNDPVETILFGENPFECPDVITVQNNDQVEDDQKSWSGYEKQCEKDDGTMLFSEYEEYYTQEADYTAQDCVEDTFEFDIEGNDLSSTWFEHIVSSRSSPSIRDLLNGSSLDNMASMRFENEACEREFRLMETQFAHYMKLKRSLDSVVERPRFGFGITPCMKRETI